MLHFDSDYMETAHPDILKRMGEINFIKKPGYGTDEICASARKKIREAAGCPEAEVFFISGGTQTNASVIRSVLRPYEGVIAADTGHISTHEAGAIEAGGHKVLTIGGRDGKLSADDVQAYMEGFYGDENHEHMVKPGMVYISHPTEYGTLYSREELFRLKSVCGKYQIPLFLDGARLAYGLASPGSDVSLKDIAAACDVFYIGGTKCGAMIGEAVVFTRHLTDGFFTMVKQNGALLAKGWIMGVQFDVLFSDDLYLSCGKNAVECAMMLKQGLLDKGYELSMDSPTNQQFVVLPNDRMEELKKKVSFGFWEIRDADHTVVRFATSWATKKEEVRELLQLL